MKAPVGLLSSGAVCDSRWRGVAPTSSRLIPDGRVSKSLSEKMCNESHNCKGAVRRKGRKIMKCDARVCSFNMDTGCVELLLRDGRMISIDCTGVEDARDVTMAQRSELDYLVYNDPLGYADLILNGDPEEYLKNVTGSHRLEN